MINFDDKETFYGFLWCIFLSPIVFMMHPLVVLMIWFGWFIGIAYPNRKKKKIIVKTNEHHEFFFQYSSYEETPDHIYITQEIKKAKKCGRERDIPCLQKLDDEQREKYESSRKWYLESGMVDVLEKKGK